MMYNLFIDRLTGSSLYVANKISKIREICGTMAAVVGEEESKIAIIVGAEMILGFLTPDTKYLKNYDKFLHKAFDNLARKEKKAKRLLDAQALIFCLTIFIINLTVASGEEEKDEEEYKEN